MKQLKKVFLVMLSMTIVLGTTACGSRNNMDDNAGNGTPTKQENMNGTTTGSNKADGNDGVVDDLGNAIGNGVEDVGQGVKDITDDATNDTQNTKNMTNDATNGTINRSDY